MLSIKPHVLLAPFTTFKLGGPAEFFAEVTTTGELIEALEYAEKNELKTFVFSGGSNLLINDRGVKGLVIHVANVSLRVQDRTIMTDAGADLLTVVKTASGAGLAGMERLAGIPGSVGGAVRGNAGAFGMEIKDVVKTVKFYDCKVGKLREFNNAECQFGYRSSYFKIHPESVILSAELELQSGDQTELERINRDTIAKREAKHPQSAKCAGSFFMNPIVANRDLHVEFEKDTGLESKGDKLPAGWLIDHVGLRGKKIGGAQVSQLHPNYFVNTGSATAENVIMLASLVKQRVRTELGVELREEVQLVGF